MLIEYIDEYICGLDSKACGEDFEYSVEFIELERLIRVQDTVEYGQYVYTSEPVDWVRVEKLCRDLYENTLDLRVIVILARCLLERYGLSGFIAGLRLISLLLRQRWENFHPQLVAENQFDPLIRINTLAELAVPAIIMVALKRQVLATTEDGQVLYLADLETIYSAQGSAQSEQHKLLSKLISPNCSVELVRNIGQINAICRELNEITLCLEAKAEIQNMSPLQSMSGSLRKWVSVVEADISVVAAQPSASIHQESGGFAQTKQGNSESLGNSYQSREDIVRALDAICSYYNEQEPSSPIPFLLARVRRLTTMRFINIIAELAPEALTDLRRLGESSIE